MKDIDVCTIEDEHSVDVYPRRDLVLVRGEGTTLYDDQGKEYIDCMGQMGVMIAGYGNQRINDAIKKQSDRLVHAYSMFYNDVRAQLLKRLGNLVSGLPKVFLCNSGAEAVEAAVKFARSTTGRHGVVAAMRAYHGKTLGALSATWNPKYRDAFEPLVPGFTHAPFNNFEKLAELINNDTAAIILEPIQGEGGVNVGEVEYFKKIRALCDEKDVLLILDEVQTGLCRTGKMFAFEHFDIKPDIVCIAKGIANGIPMGAVICKDTITVPKNGHTTTFGGNPLACAASLATFDYIADEGLAERTASLGSYFMDKLRRIDSNKIRSVRGRGLMIGVELKEKAGKYVQKLQEEGVLVVLSGTLVIRLLPPLVITREQIDAVVTKLEKVLADQGSP